MPEIKVLRTSEYAKLPTQATDRAQCIDFYAAEPAEIYPGETVLVDLGVKLILPDGYGLEFRERSGLASRGIIIGAGIIDEDYHGPLKAVVRFMGAGKNGTVPHNHRVQVATGDKIVQAELVKRIPITITDVGPLTFEEEAARSERGEAGFGSTDDN